MYRSLSARQVTVGKSRRMGAKWDAFFFTSKNRTPRRGLPYKVLFLSPFVPFRSIYTEDYRPVTAEVAGSSPVDSAPFSRSNPRVTVSSGRPSAKRIPAAINFLDCTTAPIEPQEDHSPLGGTIPPVCPIFTTKACRTFVVQLGGNERAEMRRGLGRKAHFRAARTRRGNKGHPRGRSLANRFARN